MRREQALQQLETYGKPMMAYGWLVGSLELTVRPQTD